MRRLLPLVLLFLIALVTLLAGWSQDRAPVEPGEVTFRFVPPPGFEVRSVSLRGTMNDWGETPMVRQADGSWSVTVVLDEGEWRYKFFINGVWPQSMKDWNGQEVHPEAHGYVDDGFGGLNAVIIVQSSAPREAGPRPLQRSALVHNPADPVFRSFLDEQVILKFRAPRDSVASATVTTVDGEFEMVRELVWDNRELWRARVPHNPTAYWFDVYGHFGEQATLEGPTYGFGRVIPFTAVDWVRDAVFIQIFPDRFENGDPGNDHLGLETDENNFNVAERAFGAPPYLSAWTDPPGRAHCCRQYYGGDLQGIIDRLDDIVEMGFNAIYLNPIFDSGSVHGYDTHDYLKIAPRLGDRSDFDRLIGAARDHGIRIVLDLVPNHTGIGHWAFQDAVANGRTSDYWDWYFFRMDAPVAGNGTHYEGWAGLGSLPKLNTRNPAAREYLMQVAEEWIRAGASGWRVDVANEVIDREAFFREMRRRIRAIDPEAYLVAEIWHLSPEYVQGDQFDSLMNYALGRDVLLRYASGDALVDAARAMNEIAKVWGSYGESVRAMKFNVINTHDTNRALSDLGGGPLGAIPSPESIERLRLLFALLFTQPGAPVVWQGENCGFLGTRVGDGGEFYRYPIQWDRCDPEFRGFVASLAELRRASPDLTSTVIWPLLGHGRLLAYARGEDGDTVAIFNSAEQPAKGALNLPGQWRVVLGAASISASGARVDLGLPARGFVVLQRRR
jgi:glycosidase